MNVLAIDVGGTNVKVLATGQTEPRKSPSGPKMTPQQMVAGVKQIVGDWKSEVVSLGYPGPVLRGKPAAGLTISLEGGSDLISKLHSDVQ